MEGYLPKCLDSLLHQNLLPENFEIIIVNDGSKDGTLAIANSYADSHKNIKVIDKKNAGVGAARNTGLDYAKGEYLYFLDPDDYLAKNVLKELISILDENKLDILTFKSKAVYDDSCQEIEKAVSTNIPLNITDGIEYIASIKYCNEIWWYITKRDFIKETGLRFVEGKWMEDAILTAELFCQAKRIAHIPTDVHRYRILPNSAMRNKSPEHYKKVIYDNANAAIVFHDLIKKVPKNHNKAAACIHRLKTRQQSFVFFLLVRLMKSDISVDAIPPMLTKFQKVEAYPLNNFIGKDYNRFSYSVLVPIFNRKKLIKPFVKIFRTFYNFVK
jgi:glycosyltransferase involved in cell wall biosynthesis